MNLVVRAAGRPTDEASLTAGAGAARPTQARLGRRTPCGVALPRGSRAHMARRGWAPSWRRDVRIRRGGNGSRYPPPGSPAVNLAHDCLVGCRRPARLTQ